MRRFDDDGCKSKTPLRYSFDDKRQALERWLTVRPDAVTPKIALALLWERYAWAGRGCGWARQTTEAQWIALEERMAKTRELLEPLDPNVDPEIFLIDMDALAAAEEPKAKLLSLYERATRAFPDVYEFAGPRFHYTLPRWYGEPGEAAAFTRSLLTNPGGEAGLEAYFNVAAKSLRTERRYAAVFETSGIDYPVLIKAFAVRAAAFGVSKADMNVLLLYAVAARDCPTINTLIEKIGDGWDTQFGATSRMWILFLSR